MFVIANFIFIQLVNCVIDLHRRCEIAFVEILFPEDSLGFGIKTLNQEGRHRIGGSGQRTQSAVNISSGVSLRQNLPVDIRNDRIVLIEILLKNFGIFQHLNRLNITAVLNPHPIRQIFTVISAMSGYDRKLHLIIIGIILKQG